MSFNRSWKNYVDYSSELSEEEAKWLEKFNYDYIGYVKKDDSRYSKEQRKETYRETYAAKHDVSNFHSDYLSSMDEDFIQPVAQDSPELQTICLELYQIILEISLDNPEWGRAKVSKELEKLHGLSIDPSTVRYIWQNLEIENRDKRKQAALVEA